MRIAKPIVVIGLCLLLILGFFPDLSHPTQAQGLAPGSTFKVGLEVAGEGGSDEASPLGGAFFVVRDAPEEAHEHEDVGGVVSGGIVTVRVLLFLDRLPAASLAYTTKE